MSQSSSGEKTEEPTDKKIRDARKKGQVAKSADVSSTWLLICTFTFLAIGKNFYIDHLKEMITMPTLFYDVPFEDAFPELVKGVSIEMIYLTFPLLSMVIIMGFFINFIQVGPLLTFEPLKPDIKKMNPIQGAKKIFSKKGIFEVLKSMLKMGFLGYLIYLVIKDVIDPLLKIPFAGIGSIFDIMIPIMKNFAINICVAYVVVAVIDLFFQRKQHTKDLKMTKDEVKREFKEMEGDPLIKGERKQLHQEMMMNDTVQSTKQASALVTNPTHYAVAIFYEDGVVKLPVVTAKGKDHIAKMMIKVAQEENIPIMRDVNLARSLYAEAPVYNYIPSDLIEPVGIVLRWVKELRIEQKNR